MHFLDKVPVRFAFSYRQHLYLIAAQNVYIMKIHIFPRLLASSEICCIHACMNEFSKMSIAGCVTLWPSTRCFHIRHVDPGSPYQISFSSQDASQIFFRVSFLTLLAALQSGVWVCIAYTASTLFLTVSLTCFKDLEQSHVLLQYICVFLCFVVLVQPKYNPWGRVQGAVRSDNQLLMLSENLRWLKCSEDTILLQSLFQDLLCQWPLQVYMQLIYVEAAKPPFQEKRKGNLYIHKTCYSAI